MLGVGLVCFLGMVRQADALPPDFQNEPVLSGLNLPVFLVTLPDNRMLVLQKGGEIRIFDPQVTPATSTIYMTITDIESGEERGLTSLVLDPDFSTNGHFYVYYTHASTARNRLSRFTHNGDTASIASEVVIWVDNEDWSDCCHYGGGLDFGPDGKLYLTTGEEFDGNQAQDLTRAGGKIIRINKDGSIPPDNPFVDGPGGNLDEIWAYGLRNPYRAKWDIPNNRLYIGEVGGNVQSTAMEDLNIGRAGANYGWPFCEGVCADPAYDDPVYTYGHAGATPNGGAITAGFVYNGSLFPNEYSGAFFLGDYVQGWIRYLKFDAAGQVASVTDFSTTVNNVVSLVQGPEGALYYVDIFGEVRRITYTPGNQPPVISTVQATPVSGLAPLSVDFSVTASDPEGDPLTYRWFFGDGTEGTGASVTHVYNSDGLYNVTVQVTDPTGMTVSDPVTVQVGNPPQAQITAPAPGMLFRALDVINFSGTATDPDETLGESNYSWTVRFLHNAHTHPVLDNYVGSSGSFQVNDTGHDYFDFTGFEIILTATDSRGLIGTDRVEVYPDKVNLNLSTSPAGQTVFLDSLPLITPFAYDTMIGFRHTVSAPGAFCDTATNTRYSFSSWSDGGAQTHEVTIPAIDLNLTANYAAVGPCSSIVTAGLVLQLESDQGLVSSAGTVASWSDQSPMGNDLVASGNPQQIVASGLNSQLAVSFDGVDDKLERTLNMAGLPTGNTDRTVFLVANYNGVGFGGFAYGSPSCNQAFGLVVNTLGNLAAQGWCGANDFQTTVLGTGVGWLVQSVVLESGVMSHYKDAALIDTQTHSYNTVVNNLVVGAELNSNRFVNMDVAAIVVYNRALSPAERQQVDDYLREKYFGLSPLNIDTSSFPDATQGVAYNETLSASGGAAPYNWSIATGALPQGLTLDSATGVISGAPTIAQTTAFTLTAIDSLGASVTSGTLSLTVTDPSGGTPATVIITSPMEGDTVAGPDVLVTYSLAGSGYDHLHLMVDGPPHVTIHSLTGSYLLTGISPGAHSIIAQLVTAEHVPLSNPESTSTVNITVTGVSNQPPAATNDAGAVVTGGSVDMAVLTNDTDADGLIDPATVTIVTPPANGTLVDNGSGLLTYTHDGSATTGDSFTYTVADTLGAVSNTATVTLTVVPQSLVTTGLVLHLDADVGVTNSAGVVTAWQDQSGLGNDAVAVGDPLVLSGVLNGHPAIDFDGIGDKLERTLALNSLPSGNADRTVFLVANYRGTGFGGFAYGTDACNQTFGLVVNTTGNLMVQGWCSASDFAAPDVGTGAGWLVQSAVLNGGVLTHYKDGTQIDTVSHTFNTVLSKMVLGAELASNTFVDMQIATVLVYNRALSATERQQVDEYLRDKYFPASGANQAPVAVADSATVAASGSVDMAVLTNDTDADGLIDPATVTIVTPPANGTLLDDGSGLLTYTHDGSATTGDSFTYTVADTLGAVSNTATVTLTVTGGANQAPVAVADSATVAASGSVDMAVLTNDTDADGLIDPATVTIVTPPANGTLLDDGSGLLTYTHDGSATTGDSFTYTVADTLGAVSNTATVTLTVTGGANQAPVAVADSATVAASGSVDMAVLTNDTDADGLIDPATVTIVTPPANGTLLDDGSGLLTYTHDGSATTGDSFTYTVADTLGAVSNTATVTLTVTGGANQAPVAVADSATVATGSFVDIAVLSNDTDADGTIDAATVTVVTPPANGTLLDDGSGLLTYTHDGSATTGDSFTYTVADTLGAVSNTATVTLTVTGGANQSPVAVDDSATVVTGGLVDMAVLSNDTDADGLIDPATVTIVTPPANGTLLDNGAGVLTYTHDGSATTDDSFTYTVADTLGAVSNTATVTLTVTGGANQAPVAVDDSATVVAGGSVDIAVLTNDTDADGTIDAATVTIVTPPANGTLVDNGSGLLTYTHDGSATTGDSFTYTVADTLGAVSNTATVTLTVVPQSLVTTGLVLHLDADVGVTNSAGVVTAWHDQSGLGNDAVAVGDPLVLSGVLNGHPAIDFDGIGDKLERTLALNSLPSGNADRTVFLVANYRGTGFGGFAYGTDACNQTFGLVVNTTGNLMVQGWCSASDFAAPDVGTGAGWLVQSAVLNGGALTHYKDGTQIDTVSHTFNTVLSKMVLGAELASNTFVDMQIATVLVYNRALSATEQQQVDEYLRDKYFPASGANQAPVAVADSATVAASGSVDMAVLTNDTDADGLIDPATVTIVTPPANGTLLDDGSGLLTYTHDGSATTGDSFTYTVADTLGAVSNTATVTLTVTGGANQAPVAVADSATVATGSFVDMAVLSNDTDADGTIDAATVTVVTPPANGTLLDDGSGLLTYTHDGSATTGDSFTYTVADTLGAVSNTATVTLTVTGGANQSPVAVDDSATVVTGGLVDMAVLSNDTDADGLIDPATVTIVTPPANGTLLDNGAGVLTYTHDGSATTGDSFTYTVADTLGAVSNTATVTLTVTGGANQAPVAVDDSATVVAGGSVDIAVLTNDTDADGTIDAATVTIVTPPANGTLVDNGSGLLTYTHDGSATTGDSFTYTVADTLGAVSNTATVTLTVVPQSLVTTGLVLHLDADVGVTNSAGVVTAWHDQSGLGNDAVAVGDPLVLSGVLNGHPAIDFDGIGDKLERTLALNSLPSGNADRTVFLVANYRGTGFGGFAYGTDACNQTFGLVVNTTGNLMVQGWCSASDFAAPDVGTGAGWLVQSAVLNGGALTHYKDGTQIDTVSHTFNTVLSKMVLGAELASNTFVDMQIATVLVYNRALSATEQQQVDEYLRDKYFPASGANQAPVAVDDSATVVTGGSVDMAVLTNDTDADGTLDPATVTIVIPPANGTVLDNGAGVLTYTHDGSATTGDSFTYTVADTLGAVSNTATVTLTVTGGANQSPVAVDDSATVVAGGLVDMAVLSNDTDADGLIDSATVTIVTPPANGTVLDNGAGVLTYTHDGSATTGDSFTYTVADTLGAVSNTATVTLTVTGGANQAPVAVADSATVVAGGLVDMAVLTNDTDADGLIDPATVTIVTPPANGTLVDNGSGLLTYTHDGSATTGDSFTYTVADTLGAVSNTATVTLTVTGGANQSPVAVADSATVVAGGLVDMAVLSNDTDADGTIDAATVTIVTPPANGTLVDNGSGLLTYTHDGSATTGDSFTYTVADTLGAVSNTATVTLTVTGGANQSPVAVDDSATVVTGGLVDMAVLSNDTDADGLIDPATVTIVTPPANGTVLDNGAGVLTYTHDGSATTGDSFTYTVADTLGAVSNTATVTLTVTGGANQAPVAVADSATVVAGGLVDMAVLSNDTDADGLIDPATVTIVTPPANGTLVDNGSGLLTYTHDGSATTGDSFTYTVADTLGAVSNTATVTLTVTGGANQSPVAVDDSATVVTGGLVDMAVLSNDTDADGLIDSATVTIVTPPANGTVLDNGAGVLTYTHDGSATTGDSFTYTVADTLGAVSNTATVTLTVTGGANQAPVAVADSATVVAGGLVDMAVLSNDTDADGLIDPATVTIVTPPANGTLVDNGSGLLTYTHDGSATTGDSFTYTVADTLGAVSNTATVTLTVTGGANQSPVAVDDSATVVTGGSVDMAVLSNDTDADGTLDPATVTIVIPPANGTVLDNGAGVLTYTHDGSATTGDSFTYTVADDQGAVSNTATVTLTVVTSSLVTNGLVLHLDADVGVTNSAGVVTAWQDQSGLGNDAVAVGDPLVLSGVLNGHPAIDFDGIGDKLERTLALNSLPSGNADRTVFLVANYRGTGFGGFAYGTDACNQTFGLVVNTTGNLMVQGWCSASDFAAPDVGTGAGWLVQSAVLNGGALTHYKDGTQIDTVSHTFNTVLSKMVLGAELASNTFVDMQIATVLVYNRALSATEQQQVDEYLRDKYFPASGANQAPVAVDDSATVVTGGSVDMAVLTNDTDADGTLDPATVTIVIPPANGTVLDNGAGVLTYTHDGSATTGDSFTYTVADTLGAVSNTATVTLTVTGGANQSPVAVDDSATVVAGGLVDMAVLSNDTDADGLIDSATVTIVTPPANGTVLDNGAGVLTYTHDGSATTGDSFTYTVADTLGAVSNTATVTLTVTGGANQAPVAVADSATVVAGGLVDMAVLSNDTDADGLIDPATVTIVTPPANGTLLDNGAGVLTYTHDGSATTGDSFTYTVADTLGAVSNTATVTLTVTGANQSPVAVDDSATVVTGDLVDMAVLTNDTDADGLIDPATVTIVTPPANGTLVDNVRAC